MEDNAGRLEPAAEMTCLGTKVRRGTFEVGSLVVRRDSSKKDLESCTEAPVGRCL